MIVSRNQAHNALSSSWPSPAWEGSSASSTHLSRPSSRSWSMPAPSWSFIFVIMMFNLRQPPLPRKGGSGPSWPSAWPSSCSPSSSSRCAGLWRRSGAAASSGGDIARLGQLLFTDYLYPFEITVRPDPGRPRRRHRPGRRRGRHDPSCRLSCPGRVLFVLGVIAFFVKRDLISQFMAIEVMLNSANLAFLALAKALGSPTPRPSSSSSSPWPPPRPPSAWPSSSSSSAEASPSGPPTSTR